MKIFNTNKIQLMKQAMNVYQKEHEAIAKNVANASNPDFNRVKTDFSKELQTAKNATLKTTSDKHIATSQFENGPFGKDGDTGEKVDLAEEMADLGVNQIKFDFIARVLKKAYNGLDASITGRMR
jgi:flagellar basal-body rod protein FlgB